MLLGTVDGVVGELPSRVDDRAAKIEQDLSAQISGATKAIDVRIGKALGIVDRRTGDALAVTRTAVADADIQLAGIRSDVNGQLTALNTTASLAVAPIAGLAQQANDAAPLWLDCEFNPDCAFNRYQGTAKAIERAADAVGKEAPLMTGKADAIAGSFQRIADAGDKWIERLTAPQTWKDQAKEWLRVLILAASRIL
jgi:hypothetical protein